MIARPRSGKSHVITYCCYFFTGLRRAEASRLTSDNVDLKARTLTVTDTKNHETLTLLPPEFIFGTLKRLLNHKMRNDVTAGPESIPSRASHNQI